MIHVSAPGPFSGLVRCRKLRFYSIADVDKKRVSSEQPVAWPKAEELSRALLASADDEITGADDSDSPKPGGQDRGAGGLYRLGLTKESLPPGSVISVEGYQAKDGSTRAVGRNIVFANGKKFFLGLSEAESGPAKP